MRRTIKRSKVKKKKEREGKRRKRSPSPPTSVAVGAAATVRRQRCFPRSSTPSPSPSLVDNVFRYRVFGLECCSEHLSKLLHLLLSLENWDKQVAWLVHILLSGEQFAASMSTLAHASRDVPVHAPAEAIGASAEFYTWLKPHSCHLLPCTSYKHVDNEVINSKGCSRLFIG
ncbi:hypothetical protein Q3G72_032308 [Acer saccharum]|nr:hypothetical protein Q3G72_032308 [Acer saccharum]